MNHIVLKTKDGIPNDCGINEIISNALLLGKTRLSMSEVEIDPDTFAPRIEILVDGNHTECFLLIEPLQDATDAIGKPATQAYAEVLFNELKEFGITKQELCEFLGSRKNIFNVGNK